jgi:hypothetical protein
MPVVVASNHTTNLKQTKIQVRYVTFLTIISTIVCIFTDFPVVNVYVTNYPVVKLLVVELSIWSNWTALIMCDIVRKRK